MSKQNSPENGTSQTRTGQTKTGKIAKLALLSGLAGLIAGAGLYALFGAGDNRKVETAQTSGSCAVDKALQNRLETAARGDVAAFQALDRSYSVAGLTFKNADGQEKSLADWTGKTVLLNLWATWCAPCRAEMPALDHLQEKLGGDNFEVVPLSVDMGDDAKPKKFFSDIAIQHMGFYHDGSLDSFNSLKKNGLAYGLPATMLINKSGCVLGVLNGPAEWASGDAINLIKTAQ